MTRCYLLSLVFTALALSSCTIAQSITPGIEQDNGSRNFCGKTWEDSSKCAISCPSGKDFQCPPGEACFAHAECGSKPFVRASPSPSLKSSVTKEEKDATSKLWEWLGPTLGAVSTVIGALIAVFCVRQHKEKEEAKKRARNVDTVEG